MISTACFRRRTTRQQISLLSLIIPILLASCTGSDTGSDRAPVNPQAPSATAAVSTVTDNPGAPSPTAFIRPTSEVESPNLPLPDQIVAAMARAAVDADVDPSEVILLTYTEEMWSSTSLGCPEEGRSYAQIVTTGYEALFSVRGELLVYHVDQSGAAIVACERGNSG